MPGPESHPRGPGGIRLGQWKWNIPVGVAGGSPALCPAIAPYPHEPGCCKVQQFQSIRAIFRFGAGIAAEAMGGWYIMPSCTGRKLPSEAASERLGQLPL